MEEFNFENPRIKENIEQIAQYVLIVEKDPKGKSMQQQEMKRKQALASNVGQKYLEAIEKAKSILINAIQNKINIKKHMHDDIERKSQKQHMTTRRGTDK